MKITNQILLTFIVMGLAACSNGSGRINPNVSADTNTSFTIRDKSDLIGGPVAGGRVGDILLKNDRIRVIIQKPRKNAGLNSFGGNIIDADLLRDANENGQDNFGSIFPLVNIEWTANYLNLEVISDGNNGGPKVVRAHGKIDVYDYLQVKFIADVADVLVGQHLFFSNRFDDRSNPFNIYEDMKGLSNDVTTDYTLEPGVNYVRIDTTFTNTGEKDVNLPIGQFVNGSGQVSLLIPGLGFSPDLMTQISGNTPALIYAGFDGVDVSYGYFFKADQFVDAKKNEPYSSTSLSYSGVTGLIQGEEFLKLLPLGSNAVPEIHTTIPAGGSRTITGYFVVGDGSAGSVMDAGLKAIGAATRPISGLVTTPDGNPVENATVAVQLKGQTLITYRTNKEGRFSGNLPTGEELESKRFGSGKYTVVVEKQGFQQNGTTDAGTCDPVAIDLVYHESASVNCVLGESGTVVLGQPVIDTETGKAIPVRLTIVGEDPSPNRIGSSGRFRSTDDWDLPFGIANVKYITAKGTFDLTGEKSFLIEPGLYRFIISHGPEYSVDERMQEIVAGKQIVFDNIKLKRIINTPGYICSDFHVHSISSADSTLNLQMRVLSAVAEGLDVLQSSDHDFVTDYASVAEELVSNGVILPNSIQTSPGDEVTPNHYGHLHAFPLKPNPDDPDGGAIDWSDSNKEEVSFAPDYDWTLDELTSKLRALEPAGKVIMVDHIMDNPSGIPLAAGWVTTPFYEKDFGVSPLSGFAEPIERRMPPPTLGTTAPFPLGTSGLVTTNFDAVELSIGQKFYENGSFLRSALPTWFNFLNLGLIVTATADSDSHKIIPEPVGMPRNYIASSTDPRDMKNASYADISLDEYAASIRAHRITVSAGPIVMIKAKSDTGTTADIGDTIVGRHVSFTVDVKAPSWGWFDTIEIYANTEPMPADCKTGIPMQGTAADPAEFYKPYRLPCYVYDSVKSFKLSDGTLKNWKEENGLITATVTFDLDVSEDTWVVAMARGTKTAKGYRSLFPMATNVLVDASNKPDVFDPANLSSFHADKKVGAEPWGLTNPIFIDMDGNGFVAKYVSEGISPIKK